jgi:hypothetical protein
MLRLVRLFKLFLADRSSGYLSDDLLRDIGASRITALNSGVKCNGFKRSGFERPCQARRAWPGRVF